MIRREHLKRLTKCVLCRAPLTATIDVSKASDSLAASSGETTASVSAEATAAAEEEKRGWRDDNAGFLAKLDRVAVPTYSSALKAMIEIVSAAAKWKRSLRILLCFSCPSRASNDTSDGATGTCAALRAAVPRLTSVECDARRSSSHIKVFQQADGPAHPTRRVFVINTSEDSVSVAGLDLGNTDLVIFDTVGAHRSLSRSSIIQAIGRALRPKKTAEAVVDPRAPTTRAPLMVVTLKNAE